MIYNQVSRAVLVLTLVIVTQQSVAGYDDQNVKGEATYETSHNSDSSTHTAFSSLVNKHQIALSKVFQEINKYFNISNTATNELEINQPFAGNAARVEKRSRHGHHALTQLETQNITLQQRSTRRRMQSLCTSRTDWKDLGTMHFPRFVKEMICESGNCWNRLYSCRPQFYPIKVLTVRQPADSEDLALPLSLRLDWKLLEVSVSVGCVCEN